MPSNGKQSDHRVCATAEEFALLCWLRLHPDVARTYGIYKCNGMTTLGSMLLQTLQAQGMAVDWYSQLPNDAPGEGLPFACNAAGAQYIKKVGKRPGNRLKKIEERVCAAPLTAAVKRRGGLPKVSFPLLLSLARKKRRRAFSSRGNLLAAPAAVALVERDAVTAFITKRLRCACGGRLAYCRQASEQCGVCASWRFVCERSCKLPPLETSKPLHGDDYLLNSKLNYACVVNAIPFQRLVDCLEMVGSAAPSTTDHYELKHEIEPVQRGQCEHSMAKAHERNVVAGKTDYASVDAGYTSLRNAHGATMGAHAPDGGIVAIVHKRLTDEGATSSQKLEVLCFMALLQCVALAVYSTIIMDGCRELVRPALAALKRVGGDLWHVQKNWYSWAEPAIKQLCARPPVPETDRAELIAVAPVKVPADREGLPKFGKPGPGADELAYAQQRVRDMGGEPAAGDDAKALRATFKALAERSVMTAAERKQQAARDGYLAEVARRKAAASARTAERSSRASAEVDALAWRREFRSLMYYVSMYTLALRGTINADTKAEWTDAERSALWLRIWRRACLQLCLGNVTHATLQELGHPAAKEKTTAFSWKPPGSGFVKLNSFTFEVLDSLVSDPTWNDKLVALIDCRSTAYNESFFHVLRKYCPQKTHYSRFYSLAIYCAVLSWNENVTRPILGGKWVRGKSGPLAKSAGRWFWVPIRAQSTHDWQLEGWELYLASLQPKAPASTAPVQAYWLGWKGEDPPRPVAPAAPAAPATEVPREPIESLKVPGIKQRLSSHGLPTDGKKAILVERLTQFESGDAAAIAAPAPALKISRISYAELTEVTAMDAEGTDGSTAPAGGACAVVQPAYVLPGVYQMPANQLAKRSREAGAPKWTKARQVKAMADISNGREPAPLPHNPKYQKK